MPEKQDIDESVILKKLLVLKCGVKSILTALDPLFFVSRDGRAISKYNQALAELAGRRPLGLRRVDTARADGIEADGSKLYASAASRAYIADDCIGE